MRPLVLHTLEGLQRAGITRAVVALGENATQIEQAVTNARLNMLINFVFVPTSVWRNLANSIMFSRIAFPNRRPVPHRACRSAVRLASSGESSQCSDRSETLKLLRSSILQAGLWTGPPVRIAHPLAEMDSAMRWPR